jgi:hypothetical protein
MGQDIPKPAFPGIPVIIGKKGEYVFQKIPGTGPGGGIDPPFRIPEDPVVRMGGGGVGGGKV